MTMGQQSQGTSPAVAAAAQAPAAAPAMPAAAPAPKEPGAKTGWIKNWNEEKKFGFIRQDDGGEDMFVHRSCLVGGIEALQKGEKVRYDVTMDDSKGKMRAVNVSSEGMSAPSDDAG